MFTSKPITKKDWDGSCDPPCRKNRKIKVSSILSEERELEVLIHEMLHAADFTKGESWITEAASDIARVLWKLGWRKR